jgi:hypothetical protein
MPYGEPVSHQNYNALPVRIGSASLDHWRAQRHSLSCQLMIFTGSSLGLCAIGKLTMGARACRMTSAQAIAPSPTPGMRWYRSLCALSRSMSLILSAQVLYFVTKTMSAIILSVRYSFEDYWIGVCSWSRIHRLALSLYRRNSEMIEKKPSAMM